MSNLYLHIDDVCLEACLDAGTPVTSPGYAIVDGDGFTVGEDAHAQARLRPRDSNSRFWDALSLDPLSHPGRGVAHHADLAYAQLEQLQAAAGAGDQAIIAVPGSFSMQQLGLLLGMCQRLGQPVGGLVDAALVACAPQLLSDVAVHVDVKLHRVVVTELRGGERCARVKVAELDGFGLVDLQEAWVESIADGFVRTTRFDPLYTAESEQAVYARLPQWLAQMHERSDLQLELSAGGSDYAIDYSEARAVTAVADKYHELTSLLASSFTHVGEIYMSPRVADLPGLRATLAESGASVHVLHEHATLSGLQRFSDQLECPPDAVGLVTSLTPAVTEAAPPRLRAVAAPKPQAKAVTVTELPTHLLMETRAFVLDGRPLVVGSSPSDGDRAVRLRGQFKGVSRRHCSIGAAGAQVHLEDHSTFGTWVNGERVSGRVVLRTGDRVQVGNPGVELLMIRQVEG